MSVAAFAATLPWFLITDPFFHNARFNLASSLSLLSLGSLFALNGCNYLQDVKQNYSKKLMVWGGVSGIYGGLALYFHGTARLVPIFLVMGCIYFLFRYGINSLGAVVSLWFFFFLITIPIIITLIKNPVITEYKFKRFFFSPKIQTDREKTRFRQNIELMEPNKRNLEIKDGLESGGFPYREGSKSMSLSRAAQLFFPNLKTLLAGFFIYSPRTPHHVQHPMAIFNPVLGILFMAGILPVGKQTYKKVILLLWFILWICAMTFVTASQWRGWYYTFGLCLILSIIGLGIENILRFLTRVPGDRCKIFVMVLCIIPVVWNIITYYQNIALSRSEPDLAIQLHHDLRDPPYHPHLFYLQNTSDQCIESPEFTFAVGSRIDTYGMIHRENGFVTLNTDQMNYMMVRTNTSRLSVITDQEGVNELQKLLGNIDVITKVTLKHTQFVRLEIGAILIPQKVIAGDA